MSVQVDSAAAVHPVIASIRKDHDTMGRLGFRPDRCVTWLINAYEQVLENDPSIKLNAAKAKVAKMFRDHDGSPVYGATAEDWEIARKHVDKLFSRLFKPKRARYDRSSVRRTNR